MLNATINGINIKNDWGFYIENSNPVGPPEVNKIIKQIPGGNGFIDLTESLYGITYKQRTILLELGQIVDHHEKIKNRVLKEVQGKEVKIIFSNDKGFYYIGRAEVTEITKQRRKLRMVIEVICDPFKYEIEDGTEPWKWDTFNFFTGIIRNYKDIQVNGTKEVKIIGRTKVISPIIQSSANLTVTYKNKTYNIYPGTQKMYDLELGDGEHILTFKGTGTITIQYRGGEL